MVDVYEISAVVAAVGVLVGVFYYVLDMRNQTRIRKTDMIMRIHASVMSTKLARAMILCSSRDIRTDGHARETCRPQQN
jgi:hypothetical protein